MRVEYKGCINSDVKSNAVQIYAISTYRYKNQIKEANEFYSQNGSIFDNDENRFLIDVICKKLV